MQEKYTSVPDSFDDAESENSLVFIEKIISKLLLLWPWLLLSSLICIGIAFLKYKLEPPVYTASASILVQDDKKGTNFGEGNVLQEFGLLTNKSSVDNEVEIVKSRSLMESVVRALQLTTRYFVDGKVRKKELYLDRPVTLYFPDLGVNAPKPAEYIINVKEHGSFELIDGEKTIRGKIGDTLKLGSSLAILLPGPGRTLDNWNNSIPLFINIGNFDVVTRMYSRSLRVGVPNKLVSVIDLGLNETLSDKAEIVLNKLVELYLQANVVDKNRTADSTVKFIDERLQLVFKELSGIENAIENFKTTNKLTDISEQAKLLLLNSSEYAKQQTEQEVQLSIVDELEKFLKANIQNTRAIPASLIMQDANFVALAQQYNVVQGERDKLLMSQTSSHPAVVAMAEQLRDIRLELLSSISSIKRGIEVGIRELKKRANSFENQIAGVPAKERIFLDYSRQQAIKQELYLFLLKKREETAISKSSTIANARVIDSAKSNGSPISPNRNKFLLIGLAIGILIPVAISYAKDFFNNKVSSLNDIAEHTKIPVLAEIGHNSDENSIAINSNSRSIIAEQFRTLRTQLQYVLPSSDEKFVLLTSSMSGEGKSFLSVNLCSSLALAGKKVILLELDLRRPKITDNLKLQQRGFTNYIVADDENWEKWIQSSGVHENFKVLSSGPLPPNPSELLMLPKTKKLFENLKSHFDYIIVDTAPIGLVTDAQIIAEYANLMLFIVRHKFTYKRQLKMIEKFQQRTRLTRVNIVINDIQLPKTAYGYGYTYGYSTYGYEQEKNKS